MRKLQQHGLYNDVNKQNEFGTKVVHLTNNIAAAEGKYAQGYAVNAGSLGMLTRFERDACLELFPVTAMSGVLLLCLC